MEQGSTLQIYDFDNRLYLTTKKTYNCKIQHVEIGKNSLILVMLDENQILNRVVQLFEIIDDKKF